jgi:hypothetical protein
VRQSGLAVRQQVGHRAGEAAAAVRPDQHAADVAGDDRGQRPDRAHVDAVVGEEGARAAVLAKALADLELINSTDTIGTPKVNAEARTVSIEADHPDGGPWLYAFASDGSDTIVATRMRDGGSYEHSALDEYGLPIEWRTVDRPGLN